MAKLLKTKARIWVRIPIIPGINDIEEEVKNIRAFFCKNGYPEKIEPLPYHAMGEHKYNALGRVPERFVVPDKEYIDKLHF